MKRNWQHWELIEHWTILPNELELLSESVWRDRMQPEDLRALTPLIWGHVNPYGTFRLNLDERLPIQVAA